MSICAEYFTQMLNLNLIPEMDIGVIGGVEDGVNNPGVSKDKLYFTPKDAGMLWEKLKPMPEKVTIAAAPPPPMICVR